MVGHPTHPAKLPNSLEQLSYDTVQPTAGEHTLRDFPKSCFSSL